MSTFDTAMSDPLVPSVTLVAVTVAVVAALCVAPGVVISYATWRHQRKQVEGLVFGLVLGGAAAGLLLLPLWAFAPIAGPCLVAMYFGIQRGHARNVGLSLGPTMVLAVGWLGAILLFREIDIVRFLVGVGFSIVPMCLAAYVSSWRGRSLRLGVALGVVLGWVGVFVLLLLHPGPIGDEERRAAGEPE